ncbi:MAG TPA: type VI secretion system baseplate subunit TssE [Polyangiaceae bacterium]|nr:type VI secretion system baseplate subunit TssE [Polyangiaceae bacterium]
MPELTPKERLQPSLLDRLTDDEPDQKIESRDRRVLSPQKLRESVLRDQAWLFNTPNLATVCDLSDFPEVLRSTVNFGLPDLAGRTLSSIDVVELERLLRRAIWDFEPRLIKNSVKIRVLKNPDQHTHNAMSFAIEADLWSQPLPLRLYLKTELDLESGEVQVSEASDIL